jgi:hypothetical protein
MTASDLHPQTRSHGLAIGAGLGCGGRVHNPFMDKPYFDRTDYSVVVKNRAEAWRREI